MSSMIAALNNLIVASTTNYRGNNTDLTFSSQSIISDTSIVPGMSDHEAVLFTIHLKAKILHSYQT